MTDEVKSVDINSLDLEEDEVQFDAAADSTEQPPPVPDGIYRAKPRFGQGHQWMGKFKDGKPTSMWPKPNVQFVIQAPGTPQDGQLVFDMCSTMIRFNGASRISTILSKMGLEAEVGQCRGHKDLVKLFEVALEQGREVNIETEWKAQVKGPDGKYKDVKVGMKNFPSDGNGGFSPVVSVPGTGDVVAQATIKKFIAI